MMASQEDKLLERLYKSLPEAQKHDSMIRTALNDILGSIMDPKLREAYLKDVTSGVARLEGTTNTDPNS